MHRVDASRLQLLRHAVLNRTSERERCALAAAAECSLRLLTLTAVSCSGVNPGWTELLKVAETSAVS